MATLPARDRLPTSAASREFAEAGGLMSYGTSISDMFRQVGVKLSSAASTDANITWRGRRNTSNVG